MCAQCHRLCLAWRSRVLSVSTENWGFGTGQLAQSVRYLPHSPENLSLLLESQHYGSKARHPQPVSQSQWETQYQKLRRLRKISNMAPGFHTQIHIQQHTCTLTNKSLEISSHIVVNDAHPIPPLLGEKAWIFPGCFCPLWYRTWFFSSCLLMSYVDVQQNVTLLFMWLCCLFSPGSVSSIQQWLMST